jgi:hypothetical protein
MGNSPTNDSRPIADDHRHAVTATRLQAVGHRVDEGVDARADVLQVDHQHVEPGQHLGGGLAGLAVERVDRHATHGVDGVRRLDHVVLQVRPEAVLRAEDRRQGDAVGLADAVDDVHDHADPQSLETSRREKARRPERDRHAEGPIIVKGFVPA